MRGLLLLAALLWGCADAPRAPALAPLMAAMDRDGDGAVDAGDYAALAYEAPPFSKADRDGDGAIDESELTAMLEGQDPVLFDQRAQQALPPRPRTPRAQRRKAPGPGGRHIADLYGFLDAELAAAGVTDGLPSLEVRRPTVAAGRLDSAEAQAVLAGYAQAYAAAGLAFPEGLITAAPPPATEPSP